MTEVKDQRYLGEEDFISRIEGEKRRGECVICDIPIEVIGRQVSNVSGIASAVIMNRLCL